MADESLVLSAYIFISRWLIHNGAQSESYYLSILFGQHHMMWSLKGSDLNSYTYCLRIFMELPSQVPRHHVG